MTGSVTKDYKANSDERIKSIGIKALYGIAQLEKAKYLLVATSSNIVGSIYSKNIFQLTKMEFFPVTPDQKYKLIQLFHSLLWAIKAICCENPLSVRPTVPER